jgi:hypothetical protein
MTVLLDRVGRVSSDGGGLSRSAGTQTGSPPARFRALAA